MLVKAKKGSDSVYEDLKNSEEFTCGMDENVEQDKLSDVSLPYMDFLENIRLLIGGASICILFLTVSRSIISREQFWRFLDALGMRRGQMYQIIFWFFFELVSVSYVLLQVMDSVQCSFAYF